MKFVIVDSYYQKFLDAFWAKNSYLLNKSYLEMKKELLATCFGTSDFYSYNLKKIGYEAIDMIVNDEILQRRWAMENGMSVDKTGLFSKLQSLPYIYKFIGRPNWIQQIALEQIKSERPDILYVQDLSILNPDTLGKAKRYCRLIVGQIAYELPAIENLRQFDLILTSFPHYVPMFRKMGIKSEYLRLAFDPRILKKLGKQNIKYDVSFVGSFTPQHSGGTKILEKIAKVVPIHVWGRGIEFLSPASPLRKNFHEEPAYGLDMYKILAQSKIAINRHIKVANDYANNMRLYEATGVGALLLTDRKKNLNDLFEVGEEVIDYSSFQDAIKKIRYLLAHGGERKNIAEAGQKRTLRDHTYNLRMKELATIIKKYIHSN